MKSKMSSVKNALGSFGLVVLFLTMMVGAAYFAKWATTPDWLWNLGRGPNEAKSRVATPASWPNWYTTPSFPHQYPLESNVCLTRESFGKGMDYMVMGIVTTRYEGSDEAKIAYVQDAWGNVFPTLHPGVLVLKEKDRFTFSVDWPSGRMSDRLIKLSEPQHYHLQGYYNDMSRDAAGSM